MQRKKLLKIGIEIRFECASTLLSQEKEKLTSLWRVFSWTQNRTILLKFTWDNTVKKEPKTLLQNIKAKEDRAIAEANKRAKELAEKQHKEREEKINSKIKTIYLSTI